MARISKLEVTQSVKELTILLRKQSKHKNMQRIQALLYITQNTFKTRKELSLHMGINRRTLEKWLSDYRQGGIESMLILGTRNRKSKCISPAIDIELNKRLQNPNLGFSSYVEAQQWLLEEHNLDVKYNTVREHLIRRFKTKIKSPRKSHIKKDDKAAEAFLKTA